MKMKVAIVLLITSWCNVITALRNLDLDWRESSPFILDHFASKDREKSSEENSFSSSYEDKSSSGSSIHQQDSSLDETRRNDEDLDTADSVSSSKEVDPLQAILPKVRFVCKGRSEGYYADTDFDCEVFHYCKTSGFRFTFVCPPKSKFNQKQMTCDYEAKDSICTDAIRHQKQQQADGNKQQQQTISLVPSSDLMTELTSESMESIKSSHPDGISSSSQSSSNKIIDSRNRKVDQQSTMVASQQSSSIPVKEHHHHTPSVTLNTGSITTTLPPPNYYQFTGNSDKYVSPQVFETTPKVTTPIPTTSPSPVYQKEGTSKQTTNSQSSVTSSQQQPSLPSSSFNYSGFQFNVNDDTEESFKPITLKGDTSRIVPSNNNNHQHEKVGEEKERVGIGNGSNDQKEFSVYPNPISNLSPFSNFSPSPPSPAFSILWNHDQANSFRPSQPKMQMKYSKSSSTQNSNLKPNNNSFQIGGGERNQETMNNKFKISSDLVSSSNKPDNLNSNFFLPGSIPPTMTTIQLQQFLNGENNKDAIRSLLPEKHYSSIQSHFANLNPLKYNSEQSQPFGIDYQTDGMMMSNYDLQPLVSGSGNGGNLGHEMVTTTTMNPNHMFMATRAPPVSFQKLFAQFPPESFKSKLKPTLSLKPPPTNLNHLSSSLTSNQLSSLLNSGSFSSLEELDDLTKFPQTDHMFGLPKVTPPKKHYDNHQHESLPHNFHTQIPNMMPFNHNGMINHQMLNPQSGVNGGSFISELNNLFSKHFTRVRPSNLLPSSSRPHPTISLPKFPPNALTSWFNKPKDLNGMNLMASSSQHSYPSFAEPPSPSSPSPPPPPIPSSLPHQLQQQQQQHKWGIFNSITKFFQPNSQPQSVSNELSGLRAPIDHKFTGMNQMQTVPLNFYHQHQPPPPRIQFRPLTMNHTGVSRPVFKHAMSVDPDTLEDDDDDGMEKGSESGMNPWERTQGIQRKVHEEEESNQSSGSNLTATFESSKVANFTIRSPRRKRQLLGLNAFETKNLPNMYPIFTSSDFNENLLMTSPSFLDSLQFLPATIVTQRQKNRPSNFGNRFVDHTDGFSNPFPTVPLPTFERSTGKSTKIKQLFIKPDIHQMLPSFSAPPLKYNPQTGTFYEPIFGSEIPIHLTMGDFQRMPENFLNNRQRENERPRENERVKASSSSNEERTPPQSVTHQQHQSTRPLQSTKGESSRYHREKMPAKVLSYEYMYRPAVTNGYPVSRKRQPIKESTGTLPLAQVTYEKVNIPPLRINDEPIVSKYRIPDKLPVNPRRPPAPPPPPVKHNDDVQIFRPPPLINEPRPRFVASLNSAIDNIVKESNFDPPKPSYHSEKHYHSSENIVDERKPLYHKPNMNYDPPPHTDPPRQRLPVQSWVPEEIPIRQSITPKHTQFIPYEAPDHMPNYFGGGEQSNESKNQERERNEYSQYRNEGYKNEGYKNQEEGNHGSQTKVYKSYGDNRDHRYDTNVHESPVTTVTPPSTTSYSYRPHSSVSPGQGFNQPSHKSVTPVYGQKLHRNSNDHNKNDYSRNQFDTNNNLNSNNQRDRYIENNSKEIVIEKQWYPEAPYTRVYATPSTTTTTTDRPTTMPTYSEWPVFKKHQNYLPPVNTGIKPVTLNDFEEETVVEDSNVANSGDAIDHQNEKDGEYAPKYPETFSVPSHYTTSTPSPSASTNMYYERYPPSESPLDNYSEYPSSVKNHHETKSDSEDVAVKVDREETTTPVAIKVEEDIEMEKKNDYKVKVFGSKRNPNYTKFVNRYKTSTTKKPSNNHAAPSPPVTEPNWQMPSVTVTTTTSSTPQESSITNYGSRVGVTRAPKTKVSVVASVSTSRVMRKPVYTSSNNYDSKNQENVDESKSYNSKSEFISTRKPYKTYHSEVTTKKPTSSGSRDKLPSSSRDWIRTEWFKSPSSSSTTTTTTSTQTVPLLTSASTTVSSTTALGTTISPFMTTTPALFTGKVQNFATLFDTIDGDEPVLEGDYDVVEEQPSNREGDSSYSSPSSSLSTTPDSIGSSSSTQSSPSSSPSSSSFLKVYSSSTTAGALNTRLSGLRMKNLFGQKKRVESSSSSSSSQSA